MIFKTINTKIEKKAYDIEIKNIDIASGHWGSEKSIVSFLDAVETLTYDKDTIDKKLILHALTFKKENLRIKDMKFFRIPDENKIVLLVVSNIGLIKEAELPLFSREMSIILKNDKFAFSIIELFMEEMEQIKKGEKTIPENWVPDEKLNDRYSRLKEYV